METGPRHEGEGSVDHLPGDRPGPTENQPAAQSAIILDLASERLRRAREAERKERLIDSTFARVWGPPIGPDAA